jgi:hypothetical protein
LPTPETTADPIVTEDTTQEPAKGADKLQETGHTGQSPKPSDQQPKTGYPEGTKVEDMTLEQQVAYWRSMSRKHEGREKANRSQDDDLRSQIEDFRRELAARDVDAARKDVRIAHPEIDDAAMGFCPGTDPEAIRKWGDDFSAYIAGRPASDGAGAPGTDRNDGHVANSTERRLMNGVGSNAASPAAPARGASNRKSNYEKAHSMYSPSANK